MLKKVIRKYCLWCSGGQPKEIKLCPAYNCSLHPFRMGEKPTGLKRLKAMAEHCLNCKCWSRKEIRQCEFQDCPLFPYRTGKNPARKGIGGNLRGKTTPIQKDDVEP